MKKQIALDEKGITLVELLVTAAIAGIVTVLIFSNLISGLNSFKSVNNQISLHDEANYIMTQFVNKIFVATSVSYNEQTPSLINVNDYQNNVTTLGFQDNNAYINSQQINSSEFKIDCSKSTIKITSDQKAVLITLIIQDKQTGKSLELDNQVSYVKVEQGGEG